MRARLQENRILTPFLFTLLLLIVFFIWVNVMVAIISEVYQQECDNALKVSWDEDFPSMSPGVPQPQNDLDAMRMHYPVQSLENEGPPKPVSLTPDRCGVACMFTCFAFSPVASSVSGGGHLVLL